MNMNTFKIRTYGRTELAQKYCPNMTARAAFRKLMQWIDLYPELNEQLANHGYTPHQRTYTPAQVQLIVDALGEP